jgi:putative Holliday junction resolvase
LLDQTDGKRKGLGIVTEPAQEPNSQNASSHPALGLDYGKARIGVAATDDFGIMAHPVATVEVGEAVLERISEIVAKRKIRTLVVGLPLRLDGTEGDSAKQARDFGKRLAAHLPDLTMVFVDETYTTMDASEKLREAGRKARDQKSVIDQAAAVEILNRWMEETS